MKKKIIIAVSVLIIAVTVVTVYLNNIFLPQKIKSLIINNLKKATQKDVSLSTLQFSIFKGLVLKNLSIYEGEKAIVSFKEASCTFLIMPLLQRKIIIPKLKIKQAEIYLVRKGDNAFNIPVPIASPEQKVEPIEKPQKENQALPALKPGAVAEPKFSIIVKNILIRNSRFNFQDETLSPTFTKSIENLNLDLNYQLPASINFVLNGSLIALPVMKITASGEYKIQENIFMAKISLQDLSAKEFSVYLKGFDISEGLVNAKVELDYKENRLEFSGKSKISNAAVTGLEHIGAINNINGELAFDNSGIRSDKLSADILGIPVKAQFKLHDFNNPFLNIDMAAHLNLDTAQGILKDNFKFNFPATVKGNASLVLSIQGKMPMQENLQVSGYADILSAFVKPDKFPYPLEDINGRINFSRDSLMWEDLNFKYSSVPYKTSGSLIDFKSPEIGLALKSSELSLDSSLRVNPAPARRGWAVSIAKLEGRYLNSRFFVSGNIDASAPLSPTMDLKGELNIEAQDLKKLFAKFKNQLERANPQGRVDVQLNLNGDLNDFKSCSLQAKLSSQSLSIYGLKLESLSLDYAQENGMANIPLMQLSLYGGAANISAKMNLNSQNMPYLVTLGLQRLNLEKLKNDSGSKKNDIAGILSSQAEVNGFYGDISKLNGAGKILITEGRLWQLNLFKGLGSLIFANDFSDIVFKEGSCDFLIKDRQILSDNIILKSNIADISGSARIGFDSSLEAFLNVKVLDDSAPLSGGFKDLTTAVMGEAGRFGVIKISGTLKEPKHKFTPAVVDIIKGIKDIIFGK